jgi:HK97 family phage major capsid protein
VQAFLDSLRNVGAFDRMLPDMKRVPLRTRVAAVSLGATGYIVGEGAPKPLTALSLTGDQLAEYVAAAILVLTEELVRGASEQSQALFRRELANAVAAVTDQQFISLITASAATFASNGATANQIHQDFAVAFNALSTDQASKLYILMQSASAKAIATRVTSTGETAFPGMSPQGGTMFNVPAVVSDGVANGTIVVADANAIAAAAGGLGLDVSTQADLQFESTPDSPAINTTVLRSLWQHNMQALKITRAFAAELLRPTGVAVINNVNYVTGNSPA